MSDQPAAIDPNLADLQQLAEIPGIGPELAARMVDARPFKDLDDLQRVSGIGPNLLARLQPYLAISPAPDEVPGNGFTPPEAFPAASAPEEHLADPVDSADHPDQPEAPPAAHAVETAAPPQPAPQPALQPAPQPPARPAGVQLGQVWWAVLAGSLVTLILSIALTLATLAIFNDGLLQFAKPGQVATLTAQVEAVQARNEQLTQDVEGLRTRIANLETLGQRVAAVEQAAGDLQGDVDTLSQQVDETSQDVAAMKDDVAALRDQSARVQSFLEGMRSLLSELFPAEGGDQ